MAAIEYINRPRRTLTRIFAFALAVFASGCAAQQYTVVEPPPVPPAVQALPFKGRLVEGDPTEIPRQSRCRYRITPRFDFHIARS